MAHRIFDFVLLKDLCVKELLCHCRDRRYVISIIVLPIIFVTMILYVIPQVLNSVRSSSGPIEIGVAPDIELPEKLLHLAEEQRERQLQPLRFVRMEDPVLALRKGNIGAALRLNPNPEGPHYLFVFKRRRTLGQSALAQIRQLLTTYHEEQLQAWKGAGPETPDVITLRLAAADTPLEQNAGFFIFALPILIVQWLIMGAQGAALGTVVRERETGASMLVQMSPAPRLSVVLSKVLGVFTSASCSIIAAIIGLVIVLTALNFTQDVSQTRLWGEKIETLNVPSFVSNFDYSLIFIVTSVSLSLFIVSLMLLLSSFAQSLKEAQVYMLPVLLLAFMPIIAVSVADSVKTSVLAHLIPVFGATLILNSSVSGFPDWGLFWIAVVTHLSLAALILSGCTRILLRPIPLRRAV